MGDRRKCHTSAVSPAEPGGIPVMLVQQQSRAGDHQRAACEHDDWPAVAPPMIAAVRPPFRYQRRLIFVRRRKHAGKAAPRGCGGSFERDQSSAVTVARIHRRDDRDRMVNERLPCLVDFTQDGEPPAAAAVDARRRRSFAASFPATMAVPRPPRRDYGRCVWPDIARYRPRPETPLASSPRAPPPRLS